MSKIRVLIVGGAGYIGSALTSLKDKNIEFTVYDCLLYEKKYLKPINFIYGDIRDYTKLNSIINDFDYIIWLAALVSESQCNIDKDLTYLINSEVLNNVINNYKGKLIFTSTCSVYGVSKDIVTESTFPNPLSAYADSKLQGEKILENFDNSRLCILRLGTLYGLADNYTRIRLDLGINVITCLALSGNVANVYGKNQHRPFIHVKDVARAILHTIKKDLKGLYIVGGINYSMGEVVDSLLKLYPESKIKINEVEDKDIRDYTANSSKFINTQFKYRHTINSGMKELIQLIKTKRLKNVFDDYYRNDKTLLTELNNYKNV